MQRPSLLCTGVSPAGGHGNPVAQQWKDIAARPCRGSGPATPILGKVHRCAALPPALPDVPVTYPSNRPVPASTRKREVYAPVRVRREPVPCGDTPLRQTHASVGDVCSEHQVCASPRERVPRPFVSFRPHSYGMRQSLPARCRGVNFLQGSEASPRAA